MDKVIDKQRVADSFSKAAVTYDSVAELQRDIGEALITYLPSRSIEVMADLGCGTGYFTPRLKAEYAEAGLINMDLAFGMLSYARNQRWADDTHWICADAEVLPLRDSSIDLIFSSLAIQWCENLPKLFSEVERVLKPGGRFVVATLGPQTLHELRSAWQKADSYTHVNRFISREGILSALPQALRCQRFDEELRVLQYPRLKQLTDELKRLGAHNMNAGQQVGLTGRERISRFRDAYEAQRTTEGYLPATYQVFYAVFEKSFQE
ncbi:malonyl-ACP O-methyltransferase BioC [uncultured Neptuniibacter sp.]|uniref:malonyl-ACP O-methyltransferase BioC n=1 Tax=uncultured Neptuniibacter sp. TaxID=502143 RepID=UPI0026076847|nr:malonyl-ACP O-methyltransferase BioC [uncultured Neptuniibacter sp.]